MSGDTFYRIKFEAMKKFLAIMLRNECANERT